LTLESQQAEETSKIGLFQQLQALALGIRTASDTLKNPLTFNKNTATSSNKDILTVTATENAAVGTNTITIEQLATNNQFVSNRFRNADDSSGVAGILKLTVGEGASAIKTEITLTNSNNSFEEIREAINNSGAKVTASVVQVDSSDVSFRLVINAEDPGTAGAFTVTFNNTSFLSTETDEAAGAGAGTDTATTDDSDPKTFAFTSARPNPGSAVTVKVGATAGVATTILEKLAEPTVTTIANADNGGNLTDNTIYYYKVTALDASGETVGTTTYSITTGDSAGGGDQQINTLTVDNVAGATSYRLYSSLTANFIDSQLVVTTTDTSGGAGTGTTALVHTTAGDGGSLTPGAALVTATQGYTVDFDPGTVKFNSGLDNFTFTSGVNDLINMDGDTSNGTALATVSLVTDGGLTSGVATSATDVAAAIKQALEAAAEGGADTYTVTFDSTAKKFDIKKDAGTAFTLEWATGSTAAATLGYSNNDTDIAAGVNLLSDTETNKVFLTYEHGGLDFQESQTAEDAILKLGTGSTSFTITKNSNTITDLFEGVTINLVKADKTSPITISVATDTADVTASVNKFLDALNKLNEFIEEQSFFNVDTEESGALFGDPNVFTIRNRISSIVTSAVTTIVAGKIRSIGEIGVSINPETGNFLLDTSKFSEILNDTPDQVRDLFAALGNATDIDISVADFSSDTKTSSLTGYSVSITRAAARAEIIGAQDISSGLTQAETLTIISENTTSVIALKSGASALSVVSDISSALLGVGIKNVIANFDSSTGKITLRTKEFGSDQTFKVTSSVASGTAGSTGLGATTADVERTYIGVDVTGTINGESATGTGQILVGNKNNTNTDGLKLQVTVSATTLLAQGANQGSVVVSRGIGAKMEEFLAFLTDETREGAIQSAISQSNGIIDDLKEAIEVANERAQRERERLLKEFAKLEQALGTLQTTSSFLTSQLKQLEANSQAFAARAGRR
jgi:flagellar hook-associated protein 2